MYENHRKKTEPTPQPETAAHHETEPKPQPAIYVASLADYVKGVLHGVWVDATDEPKQIQAQIDAMLAQSHDRNAEEWAIHDYEQFGRWAVSEYDSLEQVSRIAKGIAEHGYSYAAWANVFEGEPPTFDIESFHEAYVGHYDSVTDYVERMADDLGYTQELDKIPEHLRSYVRIDYAAIGRDMESSGEIATVHDTNGGLWIFRTNL